ncbi:MAG: YfcE family phosphodiesterase [Flavobacteriales bacterium]|nr:YfcE family phosphodiesterase [Flavobacteriales bacterium]
MKRITLISDTHHSLDKRLHKYFKNTDEIWHAGDIGSYDIIDKLKKFAPIKAVSGNIDNYIITRDFNKNLVFKIEKITVLITHIGGYPGKYPKKIRDLIEKTRPDLFICGHSHILKVIYDKKYKLLHMNPGAVGDYGIHKVKTLLRFVIEDKNIKNLEVIELSK